MKPDHPFFDGLSPTLHIAHRGGAALAPENTFAAFTAAVDRYRTQMLEIDVQLTRDGVLVVAHDDTVDRCTDGKGDIAGFTLAELGNLDAGYRFSADGGRTWAFRGTGVRIPTLREVLNAWPRLRFNIEVKRAQSGIVQAFREELVRADALGRVCIGSMHDALAAELAAAIPEACHFYPKDALTAFVLAAHSGDTPPEDRRFQVLDMPAEYQGMPLINDAFLAVTRAHRKWVNVWTIDDAPRMQQLIAHGVGGIMTDRPDVLRQVLDDGRSGKPEC